MAKSDNLHAAKIAKNDEFYTGANDIANELGHYREHFKGKTVYCNCDDPNWSNFWRYFHKNFQSLGLKKLISTHYQPDSEPSYALVYEGGNDFNYDAGKVVEIHGNDKYTAGDFRSDDCIKLLKEADIVVTNPPFSLFREYMAQLMEYDKKFVVIGSQNAITYKEFFPLLKDNEVWMGYNYVKEFKQPDGTVKKFGNICWYTNLDIKKRHDGLWHKNGEFDNTMAHCYYEGFESRYPKYDNYDAINIDKVSEIPIDYDGVMGVPITFLDKFNPDEFEIIDINPHFYMIIEQNLPKPKQLTLHNVGKKDPYARILIRNRNPISRANDR